MNFHKEQKIGAKSSSKGGRWKGDLEQENRDIRTRVEEGAERGNTSNNQAVWEQNCVYLCMLARVYLHNWAVMVVHGKTR